MFAVLTIVCFTSVGCKDKKPATLVDSVASDTVVADTQAMDSVEKLIEETPMPKAADELFDDFLFNFAANRKLQKQRVHFPLPVYRNGKVVKNVTSDDKGDVEDPDNNPSGGGSDNTPGGGNTEGGGNTGGNEGDGLE